MLNFQRQQWCFDFCNFSVNDTLVQAHHTVKYHSFKDYIYQSQEMIQFVKVDSEDQIVNCMMKGLEKTKFHQVRKMLAGW